MFSPDDTIVALATPPGRGGLAVVRLSGTRAREIASSLIANDVRLETRRATLVRVVAWGGVSAGEASAGSGTRGFAPPAGVSLGEGALSGGARGGGPAGDVSQEDVAPGDISSGEGSRQRGGRHGRVGRAIDEAIVTLFAAPASYTGEDVVEFSLHGSPVVAGEVIAEAMAAGARLARAGEFTLRAFLNGRLDLTRAEAVHDLVESTTPVQARMAFDQLQGSLAERIGEIEQSLFDLTARLEASGDFPEEGYHFISPDETTAAIRTAQSRIDLLLRDAGRGTLLREGATVAIVGRPNVGKSTLFNRLAGVDRAIVTEVPGTTRDLLIEAVSLGGARITLVDTAGVRATTNPIEREGVARAAKAGAVATLALVVLDVSAPITEDDERVLEATSRRPRVIVGTKSDLPHAWELAELACGSGSVAPEVVAVSATTGGGIDVLIRSINRNIGIGDTPEPALVSNIRHVELLGRSAEALARAEMLVADGSGQIPEELLLADLALAREALEEVTGKRNSDELLEAIFSKFCIGK